MEALEQLLKGPIRLVRDRPCHITVDNPFGPEPTAVWLKVGDSVMTYHYRAEDMTSKAARSVVAEMIARRAVQEQLIPAYQEREVLADLQERLPKPYLHDKKKPAPVLPDTPQFVDMTPEVEVAVYDDKHYGLEKCWVRISMKNGSKTPLKIDVFKRPWRKGGAQRIEIIDSIRDTLRSRRFPGDTINKVVRKLEAHIN